MNSLSNRPYSIWGSRQTLNLRLGNGMRMPFVKRNNFLIKISCLRVSIMTCNNFDVTSKQS